MAMSQSEAEAKELEKKRLESNHLVLVKKEQTVEDEEDENPELARYLNRNMWESRSGQLDRINKSPERFRNSPPSAPHTPTHQMVS